ncbi:MAG TPA: rhombosortase [Opitutaceae bacterium]
MQRPRKIEWRQYPWFYAVIGLAALGIQLIPGAREALIYHRGAIAAGDVWRLWTGHLVHFGWPHLVADTGLLLILGWLLGRAHRHFSALAFLLMPLFISGVLYGFDRGMIRYAGLSAVDFGLLVYLALQGWQRKWTDWFWPAVLAIYIGEVVFETVQGGRGGGMIPFDDPGVTVATSAHVAGAVYAVLAWLLSRRGQARASSAPPHPDRQPAPPAETPTRAPE